MTLRTLTTLQRGVLERLRYRGLGVLANLAREKWLRGQQCGISLPDHPRLDADFKRANEQVGAARSSSVAG